MCIYIFGRCTLMYLFMFTIKACQQRHLKTTKLDHGTSFSLWFLPCDLWAASQPADKGKTQLQEPAPTGYEPKPECRSLENKPVVTWSFPFSFWISWIPSDLWSRRAVWDNLVQCSSNLVKWLIINSEWRLPKAHHHGLVTCWEQSCSRWRAGGFQMSPNTGSLMRSTEAPFWISRTSHKTAENHWLGLGHCIWGNRNPEVQWRLTQLEKQQRKPGLLLLPASLVRCWCRTRPARASPRRMGSPNLGWVSWFPQLHPHSSPLPHPALIVVEEAVPPRFIF